MKSFMTLVWREWRDVRALTLGCAVLAVVATAVVQHYGNVLPLPDGSFVASAQSGDIVLLAADGSVKKRLYGPRRRERWRGVTWFFVPACNQNSASDPSPRAGTRGARRARSRRGTSWRRFAFARRGGFHGLCMRGRGRAPPLRRYSRTLRNSAGPRSAVHARFRS